MRLIVIELEVTLESFQMARALDEVPGQSPSPFVLEGNTARNAVFKYFFWII